MKSVNLLERYRRYRTLTSDKISSLPIAVLMPHSSCNCRCVMCDIWKGNHQLKQLTPTDFEQLVESLRRLRTKRVVLSGGEALLHPNFFTLCSILRQAGLKITLLTTGLSLSRNAQQIVNSIQDVIISLDGDAQLHDQIRRIKGAFQKLEEGVCALRDLDPGFPISARTVIQRLNFMHWPAIIDTAVQLGLSRISFLPADVSSQAFNRPVPWDSFRQSDVLPSPEDLPQLRDMIQEIIVRYGEKLNSGFIAESPEKLIKIGQYYAAAYGQAEFPYKRCNAPWVSTVVEPDGNVRPCFFHPAIGNIREQTLERVLNSPEAIRFRRELDIQANPTCKRCVCYLNLSPKENI